MTTDAPTAVRGHVLHALVPCYDLLARVLAGGREGTLRSRTLDRARVVAGERVLDVGCGTGTLAIAAARRVVRERR